jgi:Na+-translocating ferredoxin:NAD+ oxidoreductase RnfG subunit
MQTANRIFRVVFIVWFAWPLLSFSEGEVNLRLKKKIDAAILATYEVETSVLKNISITPAMNSETAAEFKENNLFKIYSDSNLLGYLYLGEAPSMKRRFDYIVMFNIDFTIKKSKVLIYREEHGKQIGSQRWLKQFIGLSAADNPIYGEDIDAISGATISASSMTKAVANVLSSIQILKKKELLN